MISINVSLKVTRPNKTEEDLVENFGGKTVERYLRLTYDLGDTQIIFCIPPGKIDVMHHRTEEEKPEDAEEGDCHSALTAYGIECLYNLKRGEDSRYSMRV